MKVVLWQYNSLWAIVLWDGESTYWNEDMVPSYGYKIFKLFSPESKFTIIGVL